MSDKMDDLSKSEFASEWAWLNQVGSPVTTPGHRRDFWLNAMNLLGRFITTNSPSVVGLQEMNLTPIGSGTGTDAIQTMISAINTNNTDTTNYKLVSGMVPTNSAGISIVYDGNKLGDEVRNTCLDNPNQKGRPILLLLTKIDNNYYLSVSIHGAQTPALRKDKDAFNNDMKTNNKLMLEQMIQQFVSQEELSMMKNIFIMGDLNDRYDAIQEFTIGDKVVKYMGDAPKSCCHNFDSACADADLEPGHPYTCTEQPDPKKPKIPLPAGRGTIENYKYKGDKVFGLNPTSPMEIYEYDQRKAKVSTESDHELVFATFRDGFAIGQAPSPKSSFNKPWKRSVKSGGKRKTMKRKTMKRKTMKRKTMKRKTMKRKTMKRKSIK